MNLKKTTAEHDTHVLSVCVLRHFFKDSESPHLFFEEDGYTVEEARLNGLRPIIACRIAVSGISLTRTRVAALEDGLDLGKFLEEAWRTDTSLHGVPRVLITDQWIVDQMANLVPTAARLGCEVRGERGNKKVAGGKAALQRQRLDHRASRPLTIDSVNRSQSWLDEFRAQDYSRCGVGGYEYLYQEPPRPWPDGGHLPSMMLRETGRLLAGTPDRERPVRDPQGDAQIERALATMERWDLSKDECGRLRGMEQAALLMGDVLREPLSAWQQWFEWDKEAYLFAGTETGCGLVRMRVGTPVDRMARIMGRSAKLPQRWPVMNSWTWKVDGFFLELQTWKLKRSVELCVAVGIEGAGLWWLRDALEDHDADEIRKLIRKGRFRLNWPESATRGTVENCWEQLKLAMAEDPRNLTALSFERRFETYARADEVRDAMGNALNLIDKLAICWSRVAQSRENQAGSGDL